MTATRTTTIRTIRSLSAAPGDIPSSPNAFSSEIMPSELTIDAVFDAYFNCRKHKRNTINQLRFEADLETNLVALYRDLISGNYSVGRSLAFVVTYPKIREIWAADFRDQVVHHLIYNAISEKFYRRFIRDTYACIPGRGVHDAVRRTSGFARSITQNWTRPAYAMKIDVANFFNTIDKETLLPLIERYVPEVWLRDLIAKVLFHDPRRNVMLRSSPALFDRVPLHKSLMRAPEGKGLPIGNLTSQFFANIYMNEVDQYIKHGLKARYYGRYVDDMILFHDDPRVLNQWYESIESFLNDNLKIALHPRKKWINRADSGINFVGCIIKPGRTYLRRTSLSRCRQKIRAWERAGSPVDEKSLHDLSCAVTSYLGMLRQVDGYKARRGLCEHVGSNLFIRADADYTKIIAATG